MSNSKIELPSIDVAPRSGPFPLNPALPISVCKPEKQPKKYKDIAYLMDGDYFYLLTEDACDFLDDAEKKLQSVIKDRGKDNVMSALAQAGVIDGLLSTDPSSFLSDQDKADYLEKKQWLAEAPKNAAKYHESQGQFATGQGWQDLYIYHTEQMEHYQKKGRKAAKEQGYVWDKETLYSPKETKIKQFIAQYKQARHVFAEERENTPQEQINNLEQRIIQTKAFIESLPKGYDVHKAAELALSRSELSLAKKSPMLEKLTDAIEHLALAGIATPEFALANISGDDGHSLLAEYHRYMIDADNFEQSLQNRLKALDSSTNHYAIPPKDILREEYEVLKSLRSKAKQLHQQAQIAIAKMGNPCFLLWNPSDYKTKPSDRVFTDQFPLREYLRGTPNPKSREGQFEQLRYFSLAYLAQPEVDGTTAKPDWSATLKNDTAFYTAMRQYVDRLPIEKGWFDERGLFLYDEFKHSLTKNNIQIEALGEDYGQAKEWQATLEQVLYSDELRKRIDPFDGSLQGQFFRFVTLDVNAGAEINTKLEVKSDLFSSESESAIEKKMEVKGEVVLARGEINLVQAMSGQKYLYYPSAADVKPNRELDVDYMDNGEQKTTIFCFGALQNRISIKAYGFAGANLALGAGVKYGSNGLEFSHVYQQKKHLGSEVLTTELVELKAEAQLGVELACYIDWHLPQGKHAIPDYLIDDQSQPMTLAKMAAKAEVSKEIKWPFYFRLADKKILIGMQVENVGAKFIVEGAINPDGLSAWVWQFQRLLRQCNYKRIEIADSETFNTMSMLSRSMLYSQLQIGLFLAKGKDTLDNILSVFDSDRAGIVAYTLYQGDETFLRDWIRLMHPEALGPLIGTLLRDAEETKIQSDEGVKVKYNSQSVLAMQQIVLANILRWLATDPAKTIIHRLVEEAFARTEPDETSEYKEERLLEFKVTKERIERFLEREAELATTDIALSHDRRSALMHTRQHLDSISFPLYADVCAREDELNMKVADHKRSQMKAWGAY
ncbi:hypothetical protein VIBRN418_18723 [Vibrio sp. N418]|uniref:hypothetical protein n=1 Tax=Vibrio sp. (strain N418) TaxID=701176 RepID=UPI00021BFAAD|nr:hypothetical protein [Vibrio sp. N418]EGU31859.1 hypothetical protein VIBRN418_18723 [Vibrio sp. N418]